MSELLHNWTLMTGPLAWTSRAETGADTIEPLRPFIADMISASPMTPRTEPIPTRSA